MNNLEKSYLNSSSIGKFSEQYFDYLSKVLKSIDISVY